MSTDWMGDGSAREPAVYRGSQPASRRAPAPRGTGSTSAPARRTGSGGNFGAAFGSLGRLGRQTVERGTDRAMAPMRQVSMLGVDPRSAEGQEIATYLAAGGDPSLPEIQMLVEQYQGKLIGPLTSRVRSEKIAERRTGLTYNQYGYMKGDEYAELDGLSAEALARTQDRLAALGILDGFLPGKRDAATVEAFSGVLQLSNAEGLSWAEMLGDLERQKIEMGDDWVFRNGKGDERAPFVEDAYLAPDYASLAQRVKEQLRDNLGRDPDEAEMALLTAELSGWDRDAFEVEQEGLRAKYDAGAPDEALDMYREAGTFQGVSPLDRFKESFEQRFKGEIRGIQRREETEQSQALTQGAVSTLSRMAGGMG